MESYSLQSVEFVSAASQCETDVQPTTRMRQVSLRVRTLVLKIMRFHEFLHPAYILLVIITILL